MMDNPYREFIIKILTSLEPRFEKRGTTLISELDEYGEITFIEKGKIGIGFEINKHKKSPLQFKNKCIIGAFGATFDKRA